MAKMNIFVVSDNPQECAQMLDDLRLNKMIVETTQLLCTALRLSSYPPINEIYKATHKNHPCSIWTRKTTTNYCWLLELHTELICEWKFRRNKDHKCDELSMYLYAGRSFIPEGERTPFANCTPYKEMDTFEAYKLYMADKWKNDKRPPKWTKRGPPSWHTP